MMTKSCFISVLFLLTGITAPQALFGQTDDFSITVIPKKIANIQCLKLYTEGTVPIIVKVRQSRGRNSFRSYNELWVKQRPGLVAELVDNVLRDWINIKNTSPQNIQMLRQRDQNLPMEATTYFFKKEADDNLFAIRIFNGEKYATPLEIANPGYHLDHRRNHKVILELGLVSSDPKYSNGLSHMIREVKTHLALAKGEFEEFEGVVILQTRPVQTTIFEKYGFKVDHSLANGMVQMSVSVKNFMEHETGYSNWRKRKDELEDRQG